MKSNYALAVHGGAGTIARDTGNEAPYHTALEQALRAGGAVLAGGGSALDAVEAAVVALEDDPLFNAGRGSVYTAAQAHEMDAAIMDGATLGAGAVAVVRDVRNPVRLARAVLADGAHVLLAGDGAEAFARERGFESMPQAYFHTDHRLAQLQRVRAQQPAAMALDHSAPLDEDRKLGTVGAVALDVHGHLASAVSTGGMTNKRPGRVGDSPVIGAGFYANDATCAVCATGTGEHFMRTVAAHEVHARMLYLGEPLQAAARETVMGALTRIGGVGGLIAVDRHGNIEMPFNSVGMYRGMLRAGEAPRTFIFG